MRTPPGRYVVVRASAPPWCAVCQGDQVVAALNPRHPYGPAATHQGCPHCSPDDPDVALPLVYLPMRQDVPALGAT